MKIRVINQWNQFLRRFYWRRLHKNDFFIKSLTSLNLLLIILVLSSCGPKKKEVEPSPFKYHQRVQVDNKTINKTWFMNVPETNDHFDSETISQDSTLKFDYSSAWILVTDPSYQFAASLDSTDVNQYVVVLKHSKVKSPIKNLEMYFDEVYKQISQDTFERMTKFEFQEITDEFSKSILFGKIETTIISENYTVLAAYFDDNEFVYDVTLKKSSNHFTMSDQKNFLIFLRSIKESERQKMILAKITNIYKLDLKEKERLNHSKIGLSGRTNDHFRLFKSRNAVNQLS